MRNFQKLKELSDYHVLDAPEYVDKFNTPLPEKDELYILRMLVHPKYGQFQIPDSLSFLRQVIRSCAITDMIRTGIKASWCYVTVRHGLVKSETDDAFHFDGSSFRTDIIPERNYCWVNHTPTEYKTGKLKFPADFDPLQHNLFTFAERQLEHASVQTCEPATWYMISPFCLYRRPSNIPAISRTFYRICFTDIEIRDTNNTPNALLPTVCYGRDAARSFRDKLVDYPSL